MRKILRNLVICFVGLVVFALLAKAQDEPQSLADLARKTREQKQLAKKQQANDAQDKSKTPAKAPRVITDEQVAHSVTETASEASAASDVADNASSAAKLPPDQWKSRILAQKNRVSILESNIQKENDSIQFAPANCVSGCVEWNEHQKQKQADVERMQSQLKDEQKKLDDMQSAARQQGYGNSVSDPE